MSKFLFSFTSLFILNELFLIDFPCFFSKAIYDFITVIIVITFITPSKFNCSYLSFPFRFNCWSCFIFNYLLAIKKHLLTYYFRRCFLHELNVLEFLPEKSVPYLVKFFALIYVLKMCISVSVQENCILLVSVSFVYLIRVFFLLISRNGTSFCLSDTRFRFCCKFAINPSS